MIVLAIVLLILVGAIAFLNMEMDFFSLYFTSFQLPLALIIVGLVLIVMLIA